MGMEVRIRKIRIVVKEARKSRKEYLKDGRKPVSDIYKSLSALKKAGWVQERVYTQKFLRKRLPIMLFRTRKKGHAVWLISGIHGEEPAGVDAIAESAGFLAELGKRFPIVILPLCNPKGYFLNQRYPIRGKSVGASEFLLMTEDLEQMATEPDTEEALFITRKVLSLAKDYPPWFTLDLHEDRSRSDPYIYCYSNRGADDPIGREVVRIIRRHGMRLQMRGRNKFFERIIHGMVLNSNDGSIDELLTSEMVMLKGKRVMGPSAKTGVVVETRIFGVPIAKRIETHSAIIRSIPKFARLSRMPKY